MVGQLPSVPGPSPEQQELDIKWKDYAALRERLVALEADYQTLETTLQTFEHNYVLRCGSRYATIDNLEAEIAELRAAQAPDNAALQEEAAVARQTARASVRDYQTREQEGDRPKFEPTPELKALYRRVARCVHPDLGSTEEERTFRHDFMVELNVCYRRGDVDRIQQIAMEWEAQTGSGAEESIGDQLVKVIRINANARKRIDELETAILELEQSEFAKLKRDVERAHQEERDLIGGLLEQLDQRVRDLQAELERLQAEDEGS